jgi:thioesterase domain-containing protein/acyl carrier protein
LDDIGPFRERLTALWKEILELPSFSPDDDFFLCGGNSLFAIELLIRIQREYHISLPPDTIYRYPTITEQAALLQKKTVTAKGYHPLIVPLREGGDLPPLFCVHPLDGWIGHYLRILPAIDPARPVFGIRGEGLEPKETLPTTMEEAARQQVDAIRTVQLTGPYHLLGFSNGGIIAFEIACQLQERGENIAFLGVIDMSAPGTEDKYLKMMADQIIPGGRLRKIVAGIDRHLKSHPDRWLYRVLFRSLRNVVHLVIYRPGARTTSPDMVETQFQTKMKGISLDQYPKEQHPAIIARLKASYDYLPRTYHGRMILFSTGPDHNLFPGDISRGWEAYVSGNCEVVEVPGDHSTLFNDANVRILTERIKESFGADR